MHKKQQAQDDYNRRSGLPVAGPSTDHGGSKEFDVDRRLQEMGVVVNDQDLDKVVCILTGSGFIDSQVFKSSTIVIIIGIYFISRRGDS